MRTIAANSRAKCGQNIQLTIEERKIEMLEQESTIKMEKIKAETEWEPLKFKFCYMVINFIFKAVFLMKAKTNISLLIMTFHFGFMFF